MSFPCVNSCGNSEWTESLFVRVHGPCGDLFKFTHDLFYLSPGLFRPVHLLHLSTPSYLVPRICGHLSSGDTPGSPPCSPKWKWSETRRTREGFWTRVESCPHSTLCSLSGPDDTFSFILGFPTYFCFYYYKLIVLYIKK